MRWQLDPAQIEEAKRTLELSGKQWDVAESICINTHPGNTSAMRANARFPKSPERYPT